MSEIESKLASKFICAVCGKTFGRKIYLTAHLTVSHSSNPKRHVCSKCGAKYTRADHLRRHWDSAHTDRPKEICAECHSEFATAATLLKHQRSHERRIFRCQWDGCAEAFLKHQHLRIHEYNHTGVKPFVCDDADCSRRFLLPSQLRHHQKVHLGYKCKVDGCGESFNVWSQLRKHVAEAHRLAHRCQICGKTFSQRRTLRNHESRHQCEVNCPISGCPVKLQPQFLKGHLRKTHPTGDGTDSRRPKSFNFKCSKEGCDKGFGKIHHLLRHVSEVHNKTKYVGTGVNPIKRTNRLVSCSMSSEEETTNNTQSTSRVSVVA